MPETISQEKLKEALWELVHSDRQFLLSLVEELSTTESQYAVDNQNNLIIDPIIPYYRQDITSAYPNAALDKETIERLRTLFTDSPTVEKKIETISPHK